MGGYYLDITPDRSALARYGLMIDDVQATIATALGGDVVTTTVEGRERYGVNVRYPRDFRSSPRAIAGDVLIALSGGGTVPLGEIAKAFIALAGVAAETGVVMLIYLDAAMREVAEERARDGLPFTKSDLHKSIMLGALERVRPKMMTVVAIMAGLVPILWSTGAGSEVMQRIAVPMIGGMVSSTLLTLVVIPAIYALVKGVGLPGATQKSAERFDAPIALSP